MKKTLILFCLLVALNFSANSQIDTVKWYDNLKVFKITSIIHYGEDSSLTNNFLWANYHLVTSDSTYQSQFIMHDNTDNRLLPTTELINNGWRSSGTVKEFELNSIQMNWSDIQLRDSLILPELEGIFGEINVTALY